jgi:hypothetical protein
MSYIINKYNGEQLVLLQDGTLDTTTSLGLVGKNYVGYGEVQNENFIFLLENFAGNNPPTRPILGQTWYDTANKKLNAYDGTNWLTVGSAEAANFAPPNPSLGALWLDTNNNQLFVYSLEGWTLVGPEGINGYQETRIKAAVLRDLNSVNHIVLLTYVNGEVQSIYSSDTFTINLLDQITGFDDLVPGLNIKNNSIVAGNLKGNADTASRLAVARTINGVPFDGSSNITITAQTIGTLTKGSYIIGSNYNGSTNTTWSVNASELNTIGTVVARDSTGSFEAGTVTAEKFVGPLIGNVVVDYGVSTFNKIVCNSIEGFNFNGSAGSAGRLAPGRFINGVFFDGTNDIVVSASAGTLTGTTLAANVTDTNIRTLGLLTNLGVADAGIKVGLSNQLEIKVVANQPTLAVTNGTGLRIQINDLSQAGGQADFSFVSSDTALALGGDSDPTFIGDLSSTCNIGLPARPFGKIYAGILYGTATTAQYADLAENYQADDYYEPGTVLEFGGKKEVTLAKDSTAKVAGVVTSNPAYLMNTKLSGEHVVAIALQGRVPCKVQGTIKKGDMLQAASGGYAQAAQDPKIGTVIGKALEDFEGIEGKIEVAVGRL